MKTRLFEIAADLGEHDPSNRYFESLLGMSSGRVSQLFKEGTNTKLGATSLNRLVKLGYNPDWVQQGAPHHKWLQPPSSVIDPVLVDLAALLPEDAEVWRVKIRAAAIKARRESYKDPPVPVEKDQRTG